MPFRKLLEIIWKGFTPLKDSTLIETSVPTLLARYLIQSKDFSRAGNYVKARAFMPPPDRKTSVFQINGLTDNEIWDIGEDHVARPQEKTLHGRGDILAAAVEKTKVLKIHYDNIPLRHANIIGWPEEKDRQKLLAQELAAEAELKLRP